MNEIVVIGSINADLVFVSKKKPKAGETLIGEEFFTIPGGKGANQAIAAAKLGAEVVMIGCIGNDIYGKKMMENFHANGVDATRVKELNTSTGVAGIMVANGDNSIIVVPGANQKVDRHIVDEHMATILKAKIVILQLEIPMETVAYVINICSEHHIQTILNPAPARKLSKNIIEKVTYMTPNEHEAVEIFEETNLKKVLQKYPNKLIVTQGDKGVIFNDGHQSRTVPSLKVNVVDTTGAGDTFNGAFATCLIDNKGLMEAIEYANKAAAISITKYGAQGGMPSKEDVERWN